jgi:hypothetical protein
MGIDTPNTNMSMELDSPATVRFGVRPWKLSNAGQSLDGWPKIYYLEPLHASNFKNTLFSLGMFTYTYERQAVFERSYDRIYEF